MAAKGEQMDKFAVALCRYGILTRFHLYRCGLVAASD
jgi:hypothetical protein